MEDKCLLSKLQAWFFLHSNDRENSHIINIFTIDNPGWSVFINLDNTFLEERQFQTINKDITEDNWIHCWVDKNQFLGAGGPQNLDDILESFISWCEEELNIKKDSNRLDLLWLQKWYENQCDGDWEHEFGITIKTINGTGWHVVINLSGTNLEGITSKKIERRQSNLDWYSCFIKDSNFEAQCGPNNLGDAIKAFHDWAEMTY